MDALRKAISQDWRALQSASDELKGDREVVLQAISQNTLSFPATEPPDPRRVSEGFQREFLKGSLKGFRRVSEGFQKGSAEDPSKTLLKPFENPSQTPSETPSETLLKPFWGPGVL